MTAISVSPSRPEYRAVYESKFNQQNNRRYYRYVIVSDLGQPLFDGYAGDMKEAISTAAAHLRLLQDQWALLGTGSAHQC